MICGNLADDSHHLVKQTRGGRNFPEVPLCGSCHKKIHKLEKRTFEEINEIENDTLRKIVLLAKKSNELEHSEHWLVPLELPDGLYKRLRADAKRIRSAGKRASIAQLITYIVAKHYERDES